MGHTLLSTECSSSVKNFVHWTVCRLDCLVIQGFAMSVIDPFINICMFMYCYLSSVNLQHEEAVDRCIKNKVSLFKQVADVSVIDSGFSQCSL